MNDAFNGESPVPTGYALFCPIHGRVFMREAEYDRQMARPNSRWSCPRMDADPQRFGLCGAECEFDDDTFDEWQNRPEDSAPPASTPEGAR